MCFCQYVVWNWFIYVRPLNTMIVYLHMSSKFKQRQRNRYSWTWTVFNNTNIQRGNLPPPPLCKMLTSNPPGVNLWITTFVTRVWIYINLIFWLIMHWIITVAIIWLLLLFPLLLELQLLFHYTPETKFGGVYRSHPVVGRLVGRSVQRSVAFSFSNTTSYNDQAHGEKVQCTRKITPSWLITQLLPFVTFPCPERNLKSTSWISKQFHTMVNHNMWKCSAQAP